MKYIFLFFFSCCFCALAQTNINNDVLETDTSNVTEKYFDSIIVSSRKRNDHYATAEAFKSKGAYLRKKEEFIAADSLLKEALLENSYTEEQQQKAYIFNEISALYYNLNQFDEGLSLLNDALEIGKRLNDSLLMHTILSNISCYYNEMGIHQKAIKILKKSLSSMPSENRNELEAACITNLGNYYFKLDNDSSIVFYRQALQLVNNSDNFLLKSHIYRSMGSFYLLNDSPDSSLYYLEKAYLLSKKINDAPNNLFTHFNYYLVRLLDKNDSSAIQKLDSIMHKAETLGLDDYTFKVNSTIALYYKENKNFEKAFQRLQEAHEGYAISTKEKNKVRVKGHELKLLSETKKWKTRLKEKEIELVKKETQNKWLIAILILLVLTSVSFLLFIRQKSKNLSLKKQKQTLSSTVGEQNKVLLENAVKLGEKEETIKFATKQLEKVRDDASQKTAKSIQSLIIELRRNINLNLWVEFEQRFTKIHPDFYTNLQNDFPNLTQNDKRLAAFVRLNLSNKEISELTKQSINSIEVAKSRLKKKVSDQNSPISLFEILSEY